MLKKLTLFIAFSSFCFASDNTKLETSLKEQNSTNQSKYNLGGNSGLIQAANDPLAPILEVQVKEIYTGSVWRLPKGSANNLQARIVSPIKPTELTPFNAIARLTLNASTYHAGMPVGIGDSTLEYWGVVDPASINKVGIGVAASFPTASNSTNGSGKYSAGPSMIYKYEGKYITYGFLFAQFNSFAGSTNRQYVSQTQVLPYLKFFIPEEEIAIGISNDNNFQYDWVSKKMTFVPLGLDINKIVTIGKQKFNIVLDGLYNFSKVAQTAQWQFQTTLIFLIPE